MTVTLVFQAAHGNVVIAATNHGDAHLKQMVIVTLPCSSPHQHKVQPSVDGSSRPLPLLNRCCPT